MDNPEKLATLGRQDTGRRQTKHKRENYKDEQKGPHQKPEVNPGARKVCAVPTDFCYDASIKVGLLCCILVHLAIRIRYYYL
jgi:hypothetical protein